MINDEISGLNIFGPDDNKTKLIWWYLKCKYRQTFLFSLTTTHNTIQHVITVENCTKFMLISTDSCMFQANIYSPVFTSLTKYNDKMGRKNEIIFNEFDDSSQILTIIIIFSFLHSHFYIFTFIVCISSSECEMRWKKKSRVVTCLQLYLRILYA